MSLDVCHKSKFTVQLIVKSMSTTGRFAYIGTVNKIKINSFF
jgi:hypothetical protein